MRAVQPRFNTLGIRHNAIQRQRFATPQPTSPGPLWQSPSLGSQQYSGQQHTVPYLPRHEACNSGLARFNMAAEEALLSWHVARQGALFHQTGWHWLEQHQQHEEGQSSAHPEEQQQALGDPIVGDAGAAQRVQAIDGSSVVKAFLSLLKQHCDTTQEQLACSGSHLVSTSRASQGDGTAESLGDSHWQRLLQQAEAALQQEQLQPQQASLILYVIAKLGRDSPAALLQGLLQQLQGQLQQLPPAGLTNVVWALAVLEYQLSDPARWFASFYTASGIMLHRQQFNKHQLTSLLWSVGKLKQQPPAHWIESVLAALRPSLPQLSRTQLSNSIWALSQIGYRPDRLWCKAWFGASYKALDSCNAHHLACIIGSLSLLRLRTADGRWLVLYRQCVQQQLLQTQPQQIATIMCGLAKLLSSQPPHWVTLLLRRQLQLLSTSVLAVQHATQPAVAHVAAQSAVKEQGAAAGVIRPPQQRRKPQERIRRTADIAATVWALPRLLYPTPKAWAMDPKHAALLRTLATVSLPLLPVCSAGELVQLAVGFAGLSYHPGTHWLKVHENAIAAKYSHLNEHNKARLRAAIKKLWLDG